MCIRDRLAAATAGLTDERRAVLDALLLEAPLADIQAALAGGRTTSAELVAYTLDRIARYDAGGLNAVMAPVSYTHLDVYKRQPL